MGITLQDIRDWKSFLDLSIYVNKKIKMEESKPLPALDSSYNEKEFHEFEKHQLDSFYPNGTIVCEPDHFGEWSIPDVDTLYRAKGIAEKLIGKHKKNKWPARKIARKVAEALKLKKYTGYKDPEDKYNDVKDHDTRLW
jgi:hypothetical protein